MWTRLRSLWPDQQLVNGGHVKFGPALAAGRSKCKICHRPPTEHGDRTVRRASGLAARAGWTERCLFEVADGYMLESTD